MELFILKDLRFVKMGRASRTGLKTGHYNPAPLPRCAFLVGKDLGENKNAAGSGKSCRRIQDAVLNRNRIDDPCRYCKLKITDTLTY